MMRILITGANRGIGLEMVGQSLRNGDRVVATCRRPERAEFLGRLRKEFPESLYMIPLDLLHDNDYDGLAEEVSRFLGGLDLLVNNAGVFPPNRIGSVTGDQMREAFQVNAVAPVLLTRALRPLLRRGERPLVVNISSLLGSIATGAGTGRWADYAYGPSKAALNRITRQLSLDLKPDGVIVIAQYPGWVRTDMGGKDASLSVERSVQRMLFLFSQLKPADSGRIIELDGSDAPE